uniref:non-specific serine/threonine protein kinase n=1 Tax=Blastobotrys adeninivorans TaxID=409370 RepID=A0A060TH49_BLAAD
MDNEVRPHQRKRPSFHLDIPSSEDEDDKRSRQSSIAMPQTPLVSSEDAILRFCSQSLQSYSYSESAKSTIASRIQALKRSLDYLRDHPSQLDHIRQSLVFYSAQNRGALNKALTTLRNSASSASLSILNNLSPYNQQLIKDTHTGPLEQFTAMLLVLEQSYSGGGDGGESSPIVRRSSRIFTPPATSSPITSTAVPERNATSSFLLQGVPTTATGSTTTISSGSPASSARGSGDTASDPSHKRTVTTVPPMNNELQVLEALSTPYIDVTFASLIQRTSSVTSFPFMLHSASTTNLTPLHPSPSSLALGDSDRDRSIHPSHRQATRQCIFTTSSEAPFKIMSLNDIGCLVFGMSQSDMKSRTILDVMPSYAHDTLVKQMEPMDPGVLICGALLPILKSNGQVNLASFWAKLNSSRSFIVWVIEEVISDIARVKCHKGTVIGSVSAASPCQVYQNLENADLNELFYPSLEQQSIGNVYRTMSVDGKRFPCSLRLENDDYVLESLPYMAGTVIITHDMNIVSYNENFVRSLFGYMDPLQGKPIDTIVPNFSKYCYRIRDDIFGGNDEAFRCMGLVIPEHMFRKISVQSDTSSEDDAEELLAEYTRFLDSTGIVAMAANGQTIYIDVQLRVVSFQHLALWISFFRDDETHAESQLPSQLKLLMQKRRVRLHQSSPSLSSTISIDSNSDESASDSTAPTAPEDNMPYTPELGAQRRTKKFKDFDIVQKMGEGAYGKVALARYKREPRYQVVIKSVIKERILVDTWTRDRKLGTIPNEIKVMATLNSAEPRHENIIRLLDFFEDDDFYHIEMERHGNPGTDLFDLIELKPSMPESECKSIFRQIVSAVSHLHHHGIVHRDIKDENVVVDEKTGVVKLIDFGSSAFLKQGPFDVFVGTIDYAAPEVLGGRPYSGKPQDIWALGILLYTLVYKENPFYNVDEIMEGELRIPFVMSDDCIDLIRLVLRRDLNKRPCIQDIESHQWLQ